MKEEIAKRVGSYDPEEEQKPLSIKKGKFFFDG
jgi:hypothetical protein